MGEILFSDASNVDPIVLAELRVEAMRPSLEAVGRFNAERARSRFLQTYEPRDTSTVLMGGKLIGFFVVRTHPDHLYLDHLYIRPAHQGEGLGARIVRSIQDRARKAKLPLHLTALRGSSANSFYISCGFSLERSDDLDNYYVWEDAPNSGRSPEDLN